MSKIITLIGGPKHLERVEVVDSAVNYSCIVREKLEPVGPAEVPSKQDAPEIHEYYSRSQLLPNIYLHSKISYEEAQRMLMMIISHGISSEEAMACLQGLYFQSKDLIGCVREYDDMPCKSLQQRMVSQTHRLGYKMKEVKIIMGRKGVEL